MICQCNDGCSTVSLINVVSYNNTYGFSIIFSLITSSVKGDNRYGRLHKREHLAWFHQVNVLRFSKRYPAVSRSVYNITLNKRLTPRLTCHYKNKLLLSEMSTRVYVKRSQNGDVLFNETGCSEWTGRIDNNNRFEFFLSEQSVVYQYKCTLSIV